MSTQTTPNQSLKCTIAVPSTRKKSPLSDQQIVILIKPQTDTYTTYYPVKQNSTRPSPYKWETSSGKLPDLYKNNESPPLKPQKMMHPLTLDFDEGKDLGKLLDALFLIPEGKAEFWLARVVYAFWRVGILSTVGVEHSFGIHAQLVYFRDNCLSESEKVLFFETDKDGCVRCSLAKHRAAEIKGEKTKGKGGCARCSLTRKGGQGEKMDLD